MGAAKKTIESLNNLLSKINGKYPNIDPRTLNRFILIVSDYIDNGKKNNKINNEDLELLEDLLEIIKSTRKGLKEPDDTIEFLYLTVLLIIALTE